MEPDQELEREQERVALLVEILDRRGRVRERVRVDRLPAYVGRAYSNDVILEDRFVSPRHLMLRRNEHGSLVAEDLDSVNGVLLIANGERIGEIPIESGVRLRIGETTLRLVTPDEVVPEAEVLQERPGATLSRLRNARISLAAVAASTAVFLLNTYLESYVEITWTGLFSSAVLALLALMLWAGIWAFVSRLLTHHFDFLRHWALTCLAFAALVMVIPLSEYIQFFTSWETSGSIVGDTGVCAVIGFLIYGHLSTVHSPRRRRRRIWWSVAVAGLVLTLGVLFAHTPSREFSPDIEFDVPLKSIGSDWIPATTTEEFIAGARKAKASVDALTSEP